MDGPSSDGASGAAPRTGWGARRDQFMQKAKASHGVQAWMLWLAAAVVVVLIILVIVYATKKDKFLSQDYIAASLPNYGSNNSLWDRGLISTQASVESTGRYVPMAASQTIDPFSQTQPVGGSVAQVPTLQPKLGSSCAVATDRAKEELALLEAMDAIQTPVGIF